MDIEGRVRVIDSLLSAAPPIRPGGSLLIMVGLPGAGKTALVAALQSLLPCVVISTDWVRWQLFHPPAFTADEMALVYQVCYQLVSGRLALGQRVIFDASNYLAARRQRLLDVARRQGAAVAICYVQASEEVTRQRLAQRVDGRRRPEDWSRADWPIYQWMAGLLEPVTEPHLALDTSAASASTLAGQLRDYWLSCE
ncbi:MAG: ATP-binding protein [Chloroflexota bacterium]